MNDNQNQVNDVALGWDDEITDSRPDFILLPEGEYEFTVQSYERAWYQGGAKLPPCPKATINLRVETADGVAIIKERFFLTKNNCERYVSRFYVCIGMMPEGGTVKMNWPAVVGRRGRAKIAVRTYTGNDGNEYKANEVKQFLAPETAALAAAGGAPAAPQGWTPGAF